MKNHVGRFTILDKLGQGSMATVYKAHDPNIDRTLAIKMLREDRAVDEEYRKRFLREAKAAGTLSHSHIVTVYDVGEFESKPYIAMEIVNGKSLNELIRSTKKLPVETVLKIGIQIADALDYAHSKGIVHRDIKPSNVIVDDDEECIKITDFGIARMETGDLTQHTQLGDMVGTPHFMSPEQVMGKPLDSRSDLFSLGVILYELLTGRKPFAGDSLASLFFHIATENPIPFTQDERAIPEALRQTVDKLLKKQPEKRFQSGREVVCALRAILHDIEEKHLQRNVKGTSIHLKWSILVTLFTCLVLTIAGAILYKQQQSMLGEQAFQFGANLTKLIAYEVAEPMLSRDWTTVELFVQEMVKRQNLAYLSIRDHEGNVRARGGENTSSLAQRFVKDVDGVTISQGNDPSRETLIHMKRNIDFGSTSIGDLEVGFIHASAFPNQALMYTITIVCVMLISFVAITSYIFSKLVTHPLRVLRKALAEVGNGHFSYRIGTKRGDEFGKLFEAFDNMAHTIQSRSEKNEIPQTVKD